MNASYLTVPFFDLGRSVARSSSAALVRWSETLASSCFILGPNVQQFELRMKERLGVSHFIPCANGTDALCIALTAAGVKPGMTVALPNLTFWATYEAVVLVGAIPLLIDIDSSDLQMNFEEFVQAHDTYRFEAAILVHLFGWASSSLSAFRAFCEERSIRLVEDGAQSFGVTVPSKQGGNESVYASASIATLSFYPAKVFGGCMDGGGIVTCDSNVAATARMLTNHGRRGHYSHDIIGYNSRMSELQAGFLLEVLTSINQMIESRNSILDFYRKEIINMKGITLFEVPEHVAGNGYLAVLLCENNDSLTLERALSNSGVGTARIYPETIGMQPHARNAMRASELSVSQVFTKQVLNLPLFPFMTGEESRHVMKSLHGALL